MRNLKEIKMHSNFLKIIETFKIEKNLILNFILSRENGLAQQERWQHAMMRNILHI